MAVDMFLKFEGGPDVRGESTASGHQDEIEIQSFSFGATNTVSAMTAAGLGAGRVTVSSFSLMKSFDRASPVLFQACCAGTHFRSALVTLVRAGGDRGVTAQFKLEDVVIDSVNHSGSSEMPMEQISLACAKFTIGYKPVTVQGTPDRPVFGGWDLVANKASASPLAMK